MINIIDKMCAEKMRNEELNLGSNINKWAVMRE